VVDYKTGNVRMTWH